MKLDLIHVKSGKTIATIDQVESNTTIGEIKERYAKINPSYYIERQSLRLSPRDKSLKDDATVNAATKLYFKDLGPQIGWSTVFIAEYSGPLFVYALFYLRPSFIYQNSDMPRLAVVNVAFMCWSFHYAKRVFETLFVHRFSNGTMPIMNLFKNCSYYWSFAALISYFINHPLYTPPVFGNTQVYVGLAGFLFAELGNFAIHAALRNLRPAGTRVRKIPKPTSNPLTVLFSLVSCPNYTYEVMSWVAFTIMTQTFATGLFTLAGFYQMSVWALGKHRNYKREFKDYPRSRKAIVPFLL